MFGTTNLFGFFSGFTFRSLSSLRMDSRYYQQPSDVLSGSRLENQPPAGPEVIKPVDDTTQPKDTIELSNPAPETPKAETPVVYTPETVAQNALETPAPPDQTPSDQTVPAEEQPESGPVAVSISTAAKFKLNMIFNLTQFEQTISAFAEDAKDGQVDTASYSDLNIGLRSDLKMNVRQKESYKIEEGSEGAPSELQYREKGRLDEISAALLKSRDFEAGLFYRESLKTSSKLSQEYEDGFLQVSRKLSLRYTQDFRLNLRSLNLYNTQAQALDQSGQLDNYVNSAGALVDSPQTSGDLLNSFFDTVQGYLDGAEDQMVDKIKNFFDTLANDMGLDSSVFQGARDTLVSSVESFFDRVDSAVGAITEKYLPSPATPESPEPSQIPPDSPQPELGQEAVTTASA